LGSGLPWEVAPAARGSPCGAAASTLPPTAGASSPVGGWCELTAGVKWVKWVKWVTMIRS
jgi:hypothetical protein